MQPPPNSWEYKSALAFESYKTNFLKSKENLAANDLKRAKSLAKSSSDLTQLAAILLGECALNIAVGKEDDCSKYQKIEDLIECPKIKNYYRFLQKDFSKIDPLKLDQKYRPFVEALREKNYQQVNIAIQNIQDPVSKLVAISLLDKKKLSKATIKDGIEKLSFFGYKKGVLYLLKLYLEKTKTKEERDIITKKIKILSN
jgi:hypothetical protein